jgi:hypothetical protein
MLRYVGIEVWSFGALETYYRRRNMEERTYGALEALQMWGDEGVDV